jgi:hypothetical protein
MKHAIPKVELPGGSYTPVRVEHRIQPVTCANCGNTGLRYVHTIRHARIGEIQVGKICAGRLTGNPLAAEAGERACRFRETRRARWATREWRRAKSGVSFITADGLSLIVYPTRNGYSGLIASLLDDRRLIGKRVFESEKLAQETAVRVLCHSWLDQGAK